MSDLLAEIRKLRRGPLKRVVDGRLREFERIGRKGARGIFSELCFCMLTANYSAERAIVIQKKVGNGFLTLPRLRLAGRLKALGYRFPNARAKYIVAARKERANLMGALRSLGGEELRRWVAENILGLGYKEASHFLRNIGCRDYAIIDFHILDVLVENRLIRRPKSLSRRRYLEVEGLLKEIGCRVGMDMAELDLYLWYMETGKVLK